ncbi:MAG TPA: hypothetical protein VNI60_02730, partial [Pyrinomonadaceae bacterium]|nr:hypothetical protein [Pyrinomonadaceae bacterium]
MKIRFGTSGWRAIIADEFTYQNVSVVSEAICSYLKNNSVDKRQTLIIGHDSRFMGENFAEAASVIAKQKGFRVLLCESPTPTPTISHAIRSEKAVGGINFTASHNPPEYQGIKFSTADGAPALPEITKQIEEIIENTPNVKDQSGGTIEKFDARSSYLDDLKTKIRFDQIAKAKGKYA